MTNKPTILNMCPPIYDRGLEYPIENSSIDLGECQPANKQVQHTECNGNGISLRDYFAGQALTGILASANFGDAKDWLPRKAYGLADAMLAARNQQAAK